MCSSISLGPPLTSMRKGKLSYPIHIFYPSARPQEGPSVTLAMLFGFLALQ